MKYRAEIDGIRTLAVLPVIFFHLGYRSIAGGYYGVDVFFVISGYLITGILTDKIKDGRFSMYDFWLRRVRRLLPLLVTVVLAVLLLAPFLIFKPLIKDVAKDAIYAIFSVSNFHAYYDFGDYWGAKAEQSFFLHTWSLSVEEQFYLVYPLFLWLVYRFFKNFVWPLIVITVVSFLAFAFYLNSSVEFAFYMLPTRIWELSAGGLAVFALPYFKHHKWAAWLAVLGIVMIFASYFIADAKINYVATLCVLGSFLVIVFCNSTSFVGRFLGSKPMVYIGKLSYSMYLWHWPLIVFARCLSYQLRDFDADFVNGVILLLTFGLSVLSYNLIENKTRNYRQTPKIVLAGFVIIGVLVAFFKYGNFNPFYKTQFSRLTIYSPLYNITPAKMTTSDEMNADNIVLPRPKEIDVFYKKEGVVTRVDGKNPELMMIGDSHGAMWGKTLDEICADLNVSRSFYASAGTKPFVDFDDIKNQKPGDRYSEQEWQAYAASLKNNIEKWQPNLVVFICKWQDLNNSKNQRKFFKTMLDELAAKSIKVLIFQQPPALDFVGNNNAKQYLGYLKIKPNTGLKYIKNNELSDLYEGREYIRNIKEDYANVQVFDPFPKMQKGDSTLISEGKRFFYIDDDHISYNATSYLKNFAEAHIKANLEK